MEAMEVVEMEGRVALAPDLQGVPVALLLLLRAMHTEEAEPEVATPRVAVAVQGLFLLLILQPTLFLPP
jgi:hypothetical protein